MSFWTKCLIYLPIFMALGCASTPQTPNFGTDPDFVAGGKISLRTPEGNHTVNFRWGQYARDYDVEVWGPLGQGRTQLRGNADMMTISRGREVIASGPPEAIMSAYLGWVMPIDLLPGWIKGSGVDPTNPTLETGGWLVEFSRFQEEGNALRPGRLDARREEQRIIVLVREFLQ